MEVAATLMAPKVAWELEGLAIRMQEREEEGEVSAIGEWEKAEEVARQEGKNIFITHKEVLTMPRDKWRIFQPAESDQSFNQAIIVENMNVRLEQVTKKHLKRYEKKGLPFVKNNSRLTATKYQ